MKVKKVTKIELNSEDYNVCLNFREDKNGKKEPVLDLDENVSYMYTTPKAAVELFRQWADQLEAHYKLK